MGLTNREKYCYGIGGFGKDLVYALVATYFMFYLTDVKGLSSVFAGVLLCVARIWDAINDPVMGMVVDNTHTKYGKFRPWIMIGTVVNSIILIFMFGKFNISGTALCVYISIFYILWGMTYTLMDIPYWSFIPALTTSEEERNIMSVIPRIFASFGYFIATSFSLLFVNNFVVDKLGKDQETGFLILAVLIAAIFIMTSSITVFNVKEHHQSSEKKKFKFREIFTTIKNNDQLVVIFGTVALYTTALNITSGLGIYFFKYDVGNENLFSTFTMIVGVTQVISMVIFPKLADIFSRRQIFITACILPVIGYGSMLLTSIFFGNGFALLAVAGAFVFLGFGFSQVLATAMLADAVDYGEYKLGYRSESIVFSMQTFIVKLATGVQAIIVGVGLKLIGYKSNAVQETSTIYGIRFMMFIIPIVLIILALLVYVKHYKLNGQYREEIMASLAERNKGPELEI